MRLGYDLSILRHPPAGTARYAVELLRAMRESQRDVIIEAHGWPRGPRGSPVWRVANFASEIGWLMVGAAGVALRHRVQAWYSPANTLPFALPRPLVVTIHDTNVLRSDAYDPAYAAYARLAFLMSGRRATAVIADSHDARSRLIAELGLPADRVVVAYPGIDHARGQVAGSPDPRVRKPYALFVGQTEPHKNIGRLIEAWSGNVPAGLHLVIAGPPGRDEARLGAQVAASPVRDRIVRLISVDDPALERLYAEAWCFVFPSLTEGFGLPPVEAMSRGIPTAVAEATALPEITAGAALLFDPEHPEAIAQAVRSIAEDTSLRERLRHQGPAVASRYRWATTATTVWQTIRNAIL
jgi:glycosyltransferase involved in cell wall biosynthesis